VGWRNRRPYDVVFTWMRYFADSIPAAILSRKTFDTGGLNRDLYDRVSSAHEIEDRTDHRLPLLAVPRLQAERAGLLWHR
jgi:hypothetical protein